MIAYYGWFGNYLGQASAVPPEAPLTRVPPPAVPVVPTAEVVPASDYGVQYDQKVTLTKAGLVVGGLALAAIVISASGALARRK